MKVTWVGIYDRGNLANERVHFRANVDIQLNYFVVLDTILLQQPAFLVEGRIQSANRNCYWFGQFEVKAGQNVVLYTRLGSQSTETRTDGQVYHFFFRGLPQPLYQLPLSCAVVMEINNWQTTP